MNVVVLAAPTRPSRRSSLFVVVITVDAVVLVPDPGDGIPEPGSKGAAVFAPETPKAIIEPPVMVVPEYVAVIVVEPAALV